MKYTLVSIFQILLILINCQTLTKQDTTIDDKPKEINKSLSKDKKKEIKIYPLHNAVSQGNVTKIQNLIKNKINLDEKDNEGKTAIHYAITKGDLGIINLLIKNKINLDTQDNEGKTALFDASLEKSKLLVENGADINISDKSGKTVLFYCDFQKMQLLLEYIDKFFRGDIIEIKKIVDKQDNYGYTALFNAKIKVSELLILYGANVNIKNNRGFSPINYCNINKALLLYNNGANDPDNNSHNYNFSLSEFRELSKQNIISNSKSANKKHN